MKYFSPENILKGNMFLLLSGWKANGHLPLFFLPFSRLLLHWRLQQAGVCIMV